MQKVFVFSILFCGQMLWAQLPSASRQPLATDTDTERRIQQDNFERWANDPAAANEAKDKAAAAKESLAALDFYTKAKRFVDLWQAFAGELNDKKTFNAKLAKQISKAFHNLEKSDGWPAEHGK